MVPFLAYSWGGLGLVVCLWSVSYISGSLKPQKRGLGFYSLHAISQHHPRRSGLSIASWRRWCPGLAL